MYAQDIKGWLGLAVILAGLILATGCVAYPVGYHGGHGPRRQVVVVQPAPPQHAWAPGQGRGRW